MIGMFARTDFKRTAIKAGLMLIWRVFVINDFSGNNATPEHTTLYFHTSQLLAFSSLNVPSVFTLSWSWYQKCSGIQCEINRGTNLAFPQVQFQGPDPPRRKVLRLENWALRVLFNFLMYLPLFASLQMLGCIIVLLQFCKTSALFTCGSFL